MEKLYLNKRILIAGAGAIGSFYGGLMSKAGYDVTLMARGKHLEAMRETGTLTIKSWKHGEPVINVNATDKPEGVYDIIFFCVKSQDTVSMCGYLKDMLAEDGCIISFQNGVDNPEVLAEYFGEGRTLAASLFVGLWIDPAGTVNHTTTGECVYGGWSEESKKFEPMLQTIFDASEIFGTLTDNIRSTLWGKLVWNVAYNPLSALLTSTCGPMILSDDIRPLIEEMVGEVVKAASYHGVTIPEEEWREKIAHRDSLNNYKTSMLQDIERLKNPEVDGILKPVINTLEKHGEKAPYCETVYRTLKFKYGEHFLYGPRLTADVIVRKGDSILLIERKNKPFGWALPGGFIDYGETVEQGAVRELLEETGIKAEKIELLGVYSDPERDKRGHNASVVYFTESSAEPTAGDDAKSAQFFEISDLPDDIVFDHKDILEDYLKR